MTGAQRGIHQAPRSRGPDGVPGRLQHRHHQRPAQRGRQCPAEPDGGYIVAGRETFQPGPAGFASSWLAKTTATGALSWLHVFNGPINTSLFAGVQLTPDGGYVAAGINDAFANSDNVWLVKTDGNSNVAGGQCTGQHNGATTEQPGPLTAAKSSFPSVAPPANPPAATADTPATTSLVTETVC